VTSAPIRDRLIACECNWWLVRANGGADKLIRRFSNESMIAAGTRTPNVDLSTATDDQGVRVILERTPLGQEFAASPRMAEVLRFVFHIAKGDVVVTPTAGTSEFLIRFVKGPYQYHPKDPDEMHMHRKVEPGMRIPVPTAQRDQFPRQPKGTVFALSEDQTRLVKAMLIK